MRKRGALAAVTIVVVAVGASTTIALAVGARAPDGPPQAFSLEQKREIEAELKGVLTARRKFDWHEMWAHGKRALALAERYGQDELAFNIRRSMASGCFAAGAEYHTMLALRLLDQSRRLRLRIFYNPVEDVDGTEEIT